MNNYCYSLIIYFLQGEVNNLRQFQGALGLMYVESSLWNSTLDPSR